MKDVFVYLFWPNPGNADYSSPKAIALLIICAILVIGSFGISAWRKRAASQGMRRMSKSWPSASFWFGFTGLILVVSRVEQIQYVAMRMFWVLWIAALILYGFLQAKRYRSRYYEVLPSKPTHDPRSKYLPRRKKK